jgi:hypothetical protein
VFNATFSNISAISWRLVLVVEARNWYSLFGDSENRENNYLKIRDLLSIALFNILGTHYVIHI